MTDPTRKAGKLGKKPARPGAVSLTLAAVAAVATLTIPTGPFGHYGLISDWGMMLNDQLGDCGIADPQHATMLWAAMAGRTVVFDNRATLANYNRISGYIDGDPSTDQGTDMAHCASIRRRYGLVDAHGVVHKVAGYVAVGAGNIDQIKVACSLFGSVSIGLRFPSFAMDQFDRGEPWTVIDHHPQIDGGHDVLLVGFDGTDFLVVTWGQLQKVSPEFLEQFMDEGLAYVSCEMWQNPTTAQQKAAIAQLKQLRNVA